MARYLDMPGLTFFYNQIKGRFAFKTDVGSPLKASTKAGMTDPNRIYIYTGSEQGMENGHWYYKDGNYWVDGGVYNSIAVETDKNLSIEDIPADAKAVGDEISDLKSAVNENLFLQRHYENLEVQTSPRYGSLGTEFKEGRLYTIKFYAENWTTPESTYALILRSATSPATNSTNFNEGVVDTFKIITGSELPSSGTLDLEISYTPSNDARYLSFYVRSGAQTTFDLDVYSSMSNQEETQDDIIYEINPAANLFYNHTTYTATDGYTSSVGSIASVPMIFPCPVKITLSDGWMSVFFTDPELNGYYTGYSNGAVIPANKTFVLACQSGTTPKSMLNGLRFLVTKVGYDDYRNKYFKEITETLFFSLTDVYNTYLKRTGLVIADANSRGLLHQYGSNLSKRSSVILYSSEDVDIKVNRFYSAVVYVMAPDGTLIAEVSQEQTYTVSANTEFMLAMTCSNTSSDTALGANVVISRPLKSNGYTHGTLPFNTTISLSRVDCAFIDENGALYYINRNGAYFVVEPGQSPVQKTLVGDVGHANSCNYVSGKVYVSDWTAKNLIHVFSVDTTEKTLTYAYDIDIPVGDDDGATEYFVFSGEKQIYSLSMTSDYMAMRFAVWIKTNGTYIRSHSQMLPMQDNQAAWIQGFTYIDGKIIYIMGQSNYNHIGLGVLDISTGELSFLPTMSNVSGIELESIIPVGENLFYDISVRGAIYTQYISKN